MNTRCLYPFAALVGQAPMKLALLLNAVAPEIGGVLLRGEKGTAKSTAARALAELLPPNEASTPAPFVDLPLGATEDRVVGSIDLERALREGHAKLQPGLMARADGGILYVDEVNLLDDHLVDCVLDAASSGINRIEREGLSAEHPARFVLVGTMNPEEGDLRPQLLDRFGLAVAVKSERDPATRKALLRSRETFDTDPLAFRARFAQETMTLRKRLADARRRARSVVLPPHLLGFIAEICLSNHVAGHRADLVIQCAARAHAAWEGRAEVTAEDITAVAPMVLSHRTRNSEPEMSPPPPPPSQDDSGEDESTENDEGEKHETPSPPTNDEPTPEPNDGPEENGNDETALPPPPPVGEDARDDIQATGDPYQVRRFQQDDLRTLRTGSGRRNRSRSATRQGRYIKSSFRAKDNDLALDATLRAAAPFQQARRERRGTHLAVYIDPPDRRGKVREKRIGSFLLFAVDASGSMGAQKRMVETKAAILSLLLDAYQKRDRVALIAFRGRDSQLLLPPTNSVEKAAKLLDELPVGGRTPLPAGLVEVERVLEITLRKEPLLSPLVLLLTDGRANAGFESPLRPHEQAFVLCDRLTQRFPQARFVVVDTEPPSLIRLGLAEKIAQALHADYYQTHDLKAEELIQISQQTTR